MLVATARLRSRSIIGVVALDDDAARFFFRLEREKRARLRFLEKLSERSKTVIRLVETGRTALQRLLHHRAPDLLFRTAFREERLHRFHHEVERFLYLVRFRGRRLRHG